MTYSSGIPVASESPSAFPVQSQTNFARLKTIIGADHEFNDTTATNDGWHNIVHLNEPTPPTGALAAKGRFYAKTSALRVHAFYMDSSGTEYQMSPTMPIRAAVNFNGTIAVPSLRSSYNVTSVAKDNTGLYTITFTNAMPDNNYIVQATGMRDTTSGVSIGCVYGDTYGTAVTATTLTVVFFNESGSPRDVVAGNVTVFSVT